MRRWLLATTLLIAACTPNLTPGQPGASGPAGASAGFSASVDQLRVGVGEQQYVGALLKTPQGPPAAGSVRWASDNTRVATVTPEGRLEGLAPGQAFVTATHANGAQVRLTVTVGDNQTVRLIQVDPGAPTLPVGASVTLAAQVSMANGTVNANVTWSVADGTIAAINPTTGELVAQQPGKTTLVAAYTPDARFKQEVAVTVLPAGAPLPGQAQEDVIFGPDSQKPIGVPVSQGVVIGTWKPIKTPFEGYPSALRFTSDQEGWAATNAKLYKTSTGEEGFQAVAFPLRPDETIVGLAFQTHAAGFVLTNQGAYRTTDGGATWTRTLDKAFAQGLSLTEGGVAYACGYAEVMRTADYGQTFTPETLPPLPRPQVLMPLQIHAMGNARALVTTEGIYRQTATGAWARSLGGKLPALAMRGARSWMALVDQRLYRTTDAGQVWLPMVPKGRDGNPFNPTYFGLGPTVMGVLPDGFAYIVTQHNTVLSVDAGQTWETYLPDGTVSLPTVSVRDPYHFYLLSGSNSSMRRFYPELPPTPN